MNKLKLKAVLGIIGILTPLILSAPPSWATSPRPLVIQASASRIKLGSYEILGSRLTASPSYRGAIRAFGAPDTCQLGTERAKRISNFSTVRWRALGLEMVFGSFGAPARGGDACSEPESFYLDNVRVTGSLWTTALGLRIGDPISKLKRLYPEALPHNGSWWVITAQSTIGVTNLFPRFAAAVAHGRVAAFVFQIRAEGD
jgi:hypothetical protein